MSGNDTAPWARTCDDVRAQLALAGWHVSVAPLGVRDELAVAGGGHDQMDHGQIPVHIDGAHFIVGPIHGPAAVRSPCARCLARRWQLVRPENRRDALELGGATRAVGELPLVTPFAVAALAALIAEHLARGVNDPTPFPYVYQLRLEDLHVRRVRLAADSECPQCAVVADDTAGAAIPRLAAAPKRDANTFRLGDLGDYPLPVDALVNDVCGVLGRGALQELDLPTTAAAMGSFSTRSENEDLYEIFWGGHADTFDASLRIGIMEGLERYAGMRPRGRAISVTDSLDALGDQALDPRTCGMYSDEFYAADPDVVPFAADRKISWVWGYSLRDARPILVPEILTYYHSTDPGERFVQECSNGCASGGSMVEATLFGLMELIERDAFMLAWYGRVPLPEIDPRSIARPASREMIDRLAMYGYEARFFAARMTFDVSVVTAVATRLGPGLGTLCFGAGASLDPEAALASSLVEIATDALRIKGRTQWGETDLRAMAADFDEVTGLHDHPHLYGLPEMRRHADFLIGEPRRPARSLDGLCAGTLRGTDDLYTDLRSCVDHVTAAGFDVIVVNQTTATQRELGLHTASVIVPGLVPVDFGWSRQRALRMSRTRTAPHAAGYFDHDLRADELNPAPHPFP